MSRPDRHAPFREALARQMDGPLPPPERQALDDHLVACGPCRAVAQAYAAERGLLRGLHTSDPPRDLWARTSTALDREVMQAPGRPRLIALGSLASLGLVLAMAAGGAGLGPFAQGRPGGATPFPVTPQPIAFLTSQGNQITIYQTQVDELCPASVIECGGPDPSASPVIRVDLAAEYAPRDLALGADGNLAITARDEQGNAVYSVVTLPGQGPRGSASPPASGVVSTAAGASPSGRGRTPPPTLHRPTGSPLASATAAGSVAPPGGVTGDVQLVPILSNVIAAGAPAAWSPDGSVLAFSARPADGSLGPDVYVWRQGDAMVRAVTRDHRSYFASWAGDRIVVSRVPELAVPRAAAPSGRPGHATPKPSPTVAAGPIAVVATTYLIDPATGAATVVPLADAWLPSVDPTGHLAIFWQGTLLADGPVVQRAEGTLFVTDWTSLTGIPPTTPASASPAGAAAGADRSASPTAAGTAGATASPPGGDPAADRTPPLTGNSTSTPRPQASGSGTPPAGTSAAPAAGPSGGGDGLPAARPLVAAGTEVTDWLVRWTPDGSAYGVWTAAASGADVGLLLVANAVKAAAADPLPPTPALRAFSLGDGRVAWITPDATGQSGDLRIVTWDADGAGGAHIRISTGATLAF